MTPILCFDSLDDLSKKTYFLQDVCRLLPKSLREKMLLAYEPNVGINTLPGLHEIPSIRALFPTIPLLYGGGVNPNTLPELLPLFDGFLVGRASMEATSWKTPFCT